MKFNNPAIRLGLIAVLVPALLTGAAHAQSSVTYSGIGLGSILFDGDGQTSDVSFPSTSEFNFKIENSSDPSLDGLLATISSSTNSPLRVDGSNISTTDVQIPNGPAMEIQSASVEGNAILSIFDDSMTNPSIFNATIDWNFLVTTSVVGSPLLGSSGELLSTDGMAPNMGHFSYSGDNPGLIDLVRSGGAFETLSFQFEPGEKLSQLLTASAAITTSFSDSVGSETFEAIPEPACYASALGLLVLSFAFWRRRGLTLETIR